MTQPTNTHSSYDAKGNREDLADIIYLLAPDETPCLTSFEKVKATAVYHEWQRDDLQSSATNYVIEGDEATMDAINATTRLGNYTCISDKTATVTGTQEAVRTAGRKSDMAYHLKKKMKELKRDVEKMICDNNARVAGNDTLAREAAGLPSWIFSNINKASDGTAATGDGTDAYTTGTARALAESYVEDALAAAWNSGGSPTLGILGAFQKRKFAAFTGNTTRTQEQGKGKVTLTNSVDVYKDPLGNEIRLVPDRHTVASMIFFLDTEYVRFATLRDFFTQDLAVTGDTVKKQIIVEWTLEVGNQKASAAVYDLTTS